jgi:hypothetical protein
LRGGVQLLRLGIITNAALDLKLLHLLGGSLNFLLKLGISFHLLGWLVLAELDGSAARFSRWNHALEKAVGLLRKLSHLEQSDPALRRRHVVRGKEGVLRVHRAEDHEQVFNVLFVHVDAKVYMAAHLRVDSFDDRLDQFSLGRFARAWLEYDVLVFESPHSLPVQDFLEIGDSGVLNLRNIMIV